MLIWFVVLYITVSVGIGRFGPYVKFGSKYVSIKTDDPYTIEFPRAVELIAGAHQRIDVLHRRHAGILRDHGARDRHQRLAGGVRQTVKVEAVAGDHLRRRRGEVLGMDGDKPADARAGRGGLAERPETFNRPDIAA